MTIRYDAAGASSFCGLLLGGALRLGLLFSRLGLNRSHFGSGLDHRLGDGLDDMLAHSLSGRFGGLGPRLAGRLWSRSAYDGLGIGLGSHCFRALLGNLLRGLLRFGARRGGGLFGSRGLLRYRCRRRLRLFGKLPGQLPLGHLDHLLLSVASSPYLFVLDAHVNS